MELSAYDAALQSLSGTGPEFGGGLSNHGAMAVGALVSLGKPHEARPWLNAYITRLPGRPEPSKPLTRQSWRDGLGDLARYSDWSSFFQRETGQLGWQQVVREWVPRLIPGLTGAAGHGLIRTAYALEQVRQEAGELRLVELADAMAYWAGSYFKLPGILAPLSAGKLSPLEALGQITWKHKGHPLRSGLISARLKSLDGYSPFSGVINLVTVPSVPENLLGEIATSMAKVQLAHQDYPQTLIPFLHGIIVAGAARQLVPHLGEASTILLVRYVWQFGGALYAIYGQSNPAAQPATVSTDTDALIEAALKTGDEHAIISADICLREYQHSSDPALLAAAWDVLERLPAIGAQAATSK